MKCCMLNARICMLLLCTLGGVSCSTPSMDTTEIHLNISVGKTIILPCMVHGLTADKKFIVIWNSPSRRPISYNKQILLGRRFDIVQPYPTEWNLKISPSQPGDSGEYLCQINTDPLQQKSVHLSVQVPPRISSSKDIPDIIEGRRLIIYCNVTGRPRPTITWYKDDVLLGNFKEEFVQINRVSRMDAGAYKCVASNGKDSDSAVINVNVWYPPEVSVRTNRMGQLLRKKAVLECHSSAYPQGKILWKKGHKVISKSTWQYEVQIFDGKKTNERTLNLMIRSLESTDFGEYVCEAENSVGKDRVVMNLYEITTASPYKDTTTTTPVIELVTSTRLPVYSTHMEYPKTTGATRDGKYGSEDLTKASTAVMVVVSDKSSTDKSSSHKPSLYITVIPLLTYVCHLYSFYKSYH